LLRTGSDGMFGCGFALGATKTAVILPLTRRRLHHAMLLGTLEAPKWRCVGRAPQP
jgi:hypothetical protein